MQTTKDIFALDQKVRKLIEKKTKECNITQKKIDTLVKRHNLLCNSKPSRPLRSGNTILTSEIAAELKDIDKSISELRDKVLRNEDILFYEQETTAILDEYKELLKIREPVSFFNIPRSIKSIENNTRRLELVSKFISIVKRYTDEELDYTEHELLHTVDKYDSCANCGSADLDDADDYMIICRDCGAQYEATPLTATYRDTQRLNTTATYEYDRKSHFKEVMAQYQGKQNASVDDSIYENLKELLEMYGLVDKDATSKKQKYRKVSRTHIKAFLKDMRVKKHYDDHIYIHSSITGQRAPDLSKWEQDIQDDHRKMLEVYKKLPDNIVGTRKNFLNSRYVLQQLLLKRNISFNKDDFVFLKSIDRMIDHNRVCEAIFKELEWKFTNIL